MLTLASMAVGLILLVGFFVAGFAGWPALRSRLPGRLILPAGLLAAALVFVAAYYSPLLFLLPVAPPIPGPDFDTLEGFGEIIDLFLLFWAWVLMAVLAAFGGVLLAHLLQHRRGRP